MAEKEEKQYTGNQPKCLAWIRFISNENHPFASSLPET